MMCEKESADELMPGGAKVSGGFVRVSIAAALSFPFMLFLLLGPGESIAAFEGISLDAKTVAMGDSWSSSDNGIHFLAPVPPLNSGAGVALSYCAPYGLSELEQKDVLGTLALGRNSLALGIFERGASLYKETVVSVSASRQLLPPICVMVSVSTFNMSVMGLRDVRSLGVGAGVRSKPIRSLDFCVGLGNLVPGLASGDLDSEESPETVPSTFLVGVLLKPGENLTLVGEIRKTPGNESSFHLGVELEPQRGIRVRCGIQTVPVELALGLAVKINRLCIESASSFHPVLGRTGIITIAFVGARSAERTR